MNPRGKKNESSGGGVAGFQLPIGAEEDAVREVLMSRIREIVRKKRGGAGYTLYAPNQGKKGKPKKAGEFPTRAQAKAAELARFPPRDPERLEKARKYVKGLRKGRRREAIERLTDRLVEAAEETLDDMDPNGAPEDQAPPPAEPTAPDDQDAPEPESDVDPSAPVEPTPDEDASRWDQLLSSLSHDALQKDSRLRSFRNRIESLSTQALDKAIRGMKAEADRRVERLSSGSDRLGRPFVAFRVHTEDSAVGPLYAVADGDRLRVAAGPEVKASATKISPEDGQAIKAMLDHLADEFDGSKVRGAIDKRDEYLDEVEAGLDEVLADLDALEMTVLKRLLADKYAGGGGS